MSYTALLSKLLPPRSYNPSEKQMSFSLALEGQAFDTLFADCTLAAGALDPFKHPVWTTDWERVYGLPGSCFHKDMTYQERIQLLVLAYQERSGISKSWLTRMALLLGYPIEIKEYRPFKAGTQTGEKVSNDIWLYAFTVHTSGKISKRFRAGYSKSGETLSTWGNELLECLINKYKPAHSLALFAYS